MSRIGEGAPFGSIDFREEDVWMAQPGTDSSEADTSIYGCAIGWDEIQAGMRNSLSRPDQVVGLDGHLHTDAIRALWLIGAATLD